jgi:hypothetical protein
MSPFVLLPLKPFYWPLHFISDKMQLFWPLGKLGLPS